MPQMTFMELIRKVLEEEQRPLSPAEIWQIAQAKGYDKSLASHGSAAEQIRLCGKASLAAQDMSLQIDERFSRIRAQEIWR